MSESVSSHYAFLANSEGLVKVEIHIDSNYRLLRKDFYSYIHQNEDDLMANLTMKNRVYKQERGEKRMMKS
jgi:hypothetical protein